MIIKHDDIIGKVECILNEHGGSDSLSIADDRVSLKSYIESAIPDAVVVLAQKGYAVNRKIVPVSDFGDERTYGKFISLIGARSKQWNKEVTKLTPMDSPEFIMSRNQFTKPRPNSPIVWWDDALGELFAEPWADGEKVTFIFNKEYDAAEGVNAGPKEATAVCYMTAALVLGMFGDDQGKQRLSDICMNML